MKESCINELKKNISKKFIEEVFTQIGLHTINTMNSAVGGEWRERGRDGIHNTHTYYLDH